jgi:hypothetical protein
MASKLDNQTCTNAIWGALDPEDAERLDLHRLINGLSRYDYIIQLLKDTLRAQAEYEEEA